jgi:hypothetical protein
LEDWSDDIDLFMECLICPDKIEELWHISRAKRMWDDFQSHQQHERQRPSQSAAHHSYRATMQKENESAHVKPRARMGLHPPEPTYYSPNIPFGLQNQATIYREATTSKIPTKIEKDLDSLPQTSHEQIFGNPGALVTDQGKPNEGGNPISPPPTLKPNPDWPDNGEELSYEEGLPLPSPQEERCTKDPSRDINLVRLLEIEDDDDSMERVNLDD